MNNKKRSILIVEDEAIFAEYLEEILTKEGYKIVDTVDRGKDAIEKALLLKPDLVLMDNLLKDNISGCEAAVQIHHQNKEIQTIFLTAYADDEMIEYAMEADAVAYLMKPYIEEEILATIKLLFSHNDSLSLPIDNENIKLCDGYIFNRKSHALLKGSQEIHLGKKVQKLIEILIENRNVSVSNEQLCTYIWGEPKNDRTLRSLIYRMRHIVDCNMIENVNGLGYKIKSMEEEEA